MAIQHIEWIVNEIIRNYTEPHHIGFIVGGVGILATGMTCLDTMYLQKIDGLEETEPPKTLYQDELNKAFARTLDRSDARQLIGTLYNFTKYHLTEMPTFKACIRKYVLNEKLPLLVPGRSTS